MEQPQKIRHVKKLQYHLRDDGGFREITQLMQIIIGHSEYLTTQSLFLLRRVCKAAKHEIDNNIKLFSSIIYRLYDAMSRLPFEENDGYDYELHKDLIPLLSGLGSRLLQLNLHRFYGVHKELYEHAPQDPDLLPIESAFTTQFLKRQADGCIYHLSKTAKPITCIAELPQIAYVIIT